ncbi:lysophospholipid acyltransferase family protein [Oceanibaculum indicum]|uniref:1-acyl-sn-glycerol-3-phosphate acyltransferase n=1 Tax=Oceanibaculum indicum TaxID=526216 RepID=A0A420WCN4_9PROT|nr:lysophospholipid acyltransferase family protein [Oceanibaculum indicum]RKQ68705.1 1-acyl-sn-glycerol-3-phosphate acyltransferase [Oceanibaculum indicum]
MGNPLLSFVRLLAYLAFTLPLMPVQALAVALRLDLARTLPVFYHRKCLAIMGFRVEVEGERLTRPPVLYVCNHASYLDITVLGSLIPGSFVAKSEVKTWPFFGWLAQLQRTVFVVRRGNHAGRQRDSITERLNKGGNLVLFPEGTSNDGNRVLPFKSALFAAAETRIGGERVQVQPVSIAYTRLNGIPIGRAFRPFFAWYGDMALAGHLWRVLGLGIVTVSVRFHPPVTLDDFPDRKAMATYCGQQVLLGVAAANAGREMPALPLPGAAPAEATEAA